MNLLQQLSAAESNQMIMYILLGAFLVLMIVVSIIPRRKQQKKLAAMMSSLGVGDMIMTIGGFVGTIVAVDTATDRFTINISSDVDNPINVVVLKRAIHSKL
ncbi:MAG: preprotein translocase subunit YajC [Christensenellaceae bacterium]|jgi:preprotein translocase subunit YajC|nr:preprotein translocase subunit YajC [Christensenellaceae bacterium]